MAVEMKSNEYNDSKKLSKSNSYAGPNSDPYSTSYYIKTAVFAVVLCAIFKMTYQYFTAQKEPPVILDAQKTSKDQLDRIEQKLDEVLSKLNILLGEK